MDSDFSCEFSELEKALGAISQPICLPTFEWPVLAGDYTIIVCVNRCDSRYKVKINIVRKDGATPDKRETAVFNALLYLVSSYAMPNSKPEDTMGRRDFNVFGPIYCARAERAACILQKFSMQPWLTPSERDYAEVWAYEEWDRTREQGGNKQ